MSQQQSTSRQDHTHIQARYAIHQPLLQECITDRLVCLLYIIACTECNQFQPEPEDAVTLGIAEAVAALVVGTVAFAVVLGFAAWMAEILLVM